MAEFTYNFNTIMRIGLISDTHIPDHARKLPEQLKNAFNGVKLILHAGDIYDISVLDELEQIAPVLAAEGDDDIFTADHDKRIKKKHIINIEGIIIWLQHEELWSWPYESVVARLKAKKDTEVENSQLPEVVVNGHTHIAKIENIDGVLLINPGSATFPAYRREPGTIAILDTNSGKPEARLIQLQ